VDILIADIMVAVQVAVAAVEFLLLETDSSPIRAIPSQAFLHSARKLIQICG
jgi:hypothetical protein